MLRTLPLILLLGTCPVFAQQLSPAIVGEGAQTQEVELLDDSVSVKVETSGALSIGRDTDADGALAISVNDTTVVGIDRNVEERTGETDPIPVGNQPSSAGVQPLAERVQIGEVQLRVSGTPCQISQMSGAQITQALLSGADITTRPAQCIVEGDSAATVAEGHDELMLALEAQNLVPLQVVAITFEAGDIVLHTR